jgi:putative glutamine amidotransferase
VRPVIGIGGDVKREPVEVVRIKLAYLEAIRAAGGVPVVLPAVSEDELAVLLERVDGLLMSGGDDVDVRAFGRELHPKADLMHPRRQEAEFALARAALAGRKPTLGVCLGMQVLAIAAGGELHQHLPDAGVAGLIEHRGEHEVEILAGSRLGQILGTTRARVVSHHHQAVAKVPASFRLVARAPDGVIEGIEAQNGRFLVGVQWHPERSLESPETQRLFRAFVEACRPS